uniref:Uncharacterized protein n=1 Tax=Varanus komodoensis TaxID=61221 RepID=A0A8D2KU28_VARKO
MKCNLTLCTLLLGYGLVPAGLSDTIKCRTTPRSFCKAVVCPPTFEPTGTCFGGSMHCCSKIPGRCSFTPT